MKKDKEQQYQGVPSQIADFLENNLGVGKGKGKAKGKPLKDSDIQSAFPAIDSRDYNDVMGEALTEFINRRIQDGSSPIPNNPPPKLNHVFKTVKTPLMDDKGKPMVDDQGNPITVDTIVDDPAPPAPYLADPAVVDPTQTPDYVAPATPSQESNPSTPQGGSN